MTPHGGKSNESQTESKVDAGADSEVTPSLADLLYQHGGWYPNRDQTGSACDCGWEGDSWSEHVASVLLASFVVLPKDQLHREWTVRSGVNVHNARGMDEKRARYVAEKWPESFTAITRLVGSWGPVTDGGE